MTCRHHDPDERCLDCPEPVEDPVRRIIAETRAKLDALNRKPLDNPVPRSMGE